MPDYQPNAEQEFQAVKQSLLDLLISEASKEGTRERGEANLAGQLEKMSLGDEEGADKLEAEWQADIKGRYEKADILLRQLFEINPAEAEKFVKGVFSDASLSKGLRFHIQRQWSSGEYK
jgi:hypothetical protein